MEYKLDYPLSDSDILSLVNTNIIDYKQLYDVKDIKDILKNGSCIILYETSPHVGHWTCLKENGDTIYFFDSYGLLIDDEFNFISKAFIKNNYYNDKTRLRKLLYYSDYKNIEYNEKQLQSKNGNVSTCGRYCVLFAKYNNTLDEFVEILSSQRESPDEIVLKLTNYLFLNS